MPAIPLPLSPSLHPLHPPPTLYPAPDVTTRVLSPKPSTHESIVSPTQSAVSILPPPRPPALRADFATDFPATQAPANERLAPRAQAGDQPKGRGLAFQRHPTSARNLSLSGRGGNCIESSGTPIRLADRAYIRGSRLANFSLSKLNDHFI